MDKQLNSGCISHKQSIQVAYKIGLRGSVYAIYIISHTQSIQDAYMLNSPCYIQYTIIEAFRAAGIFDALAKATMLHILSISIHPMLQKIISVFTLISAHALVSAY